MRDNGDLYDLLNTSYERFATIGSDCSIGFVRSFVRALVRSFACLDG